MGSSPIRPDSKLRGDSSIGRALFSRQQELARCLLSPCGVRWLAS